METAAPGVGVRGAGEGPQSRGGAGAGDGADVGTPINIDYVGVTEGTAEGQTTFYRFCVREGSRQLVFSALLWCRSTEQNHDIV